jgi:hypothetical protein
MERKLSENKYVNAYGQGALRGEQFRGKNRNIFI